jgi:hypothetical protein
MHKLVVIALHCAKLRSFDFRVRFPHGKKLCSGAFLLGDAHHHDKATMVSPQAPASLPREKRGLKLLVAPFVKHACNVVMLFDAEEVQMSPCAPRFGQRRHASVTLAAAMCNLERLVPCYECFPVHKGASHILQTKFHRHACYSSSLLLFVLPEATPRRKPASCIQSRDKPLHRMQRLDLAECDVPC